VAYDIDRIRAEFPGLNRMEGERKAVFFDNPAGTQVARSSIDRMVETMVHANANLGGFFTTTLLAAEGVAAAHVAAADFLNAADPDEVFFGQNMTSITFAFSRAIGRMLNPGDEIIVSRMDHDANISPWLMLAEDRGLVVKWFDFDTKTFEFDLSRFDALLSKRTKVVAIGHASNLTGTITDVAAVARMAHSVGALVYVDAVQLAPHGVLDVQAIGCDVLVCSAYKFFGPHYGVAWARRSLQEQLTAYKVRPASDDLPFKFVTGTTNREELAGVRGAVEYYAWVGQTFGTPASNNRRDCIVAGVKAMAAYEKPLMARLIEGLQAVPGVRIFGITDPTAFDRRVPTVSFRVDGFTTEEIVRHLAQRGIYLWHGDNYAVEPCRALGILDDGGVVRVGLAHYNKMDEVERFLLELVDFIGSGAWGLRG
jgi:cysteine desulfurase family protein (TIGR01976 family)